MPPRAPNPREAALAAAEARLKNLQAPTTDQPNVPAKEVWVQPSEQEDMQARRAFARLLDRGIVRDNNYQQSFIAVETILKIANNILSSDDPKFRTLKASNPTLKNKVLSAVGAHEYLIAMGFRTKTTDFILYYVLEPRMKRMHELKLGTEVLKEHMVQIEARSSSKEQSKLLAKDEEAQRKARALQEYEDDRAGVKARLEREKWVRENREKLKKEQEAAEKAKELQLEAQAAAFANMDRESEGDSDHDYQMDPQDNYHNDHDEDEEEEGEEEWDWRGGNVLGSASDTATSSAVKPESSAGLRNRSGGMSTEVSNSAMAQNFNSNLDG